MAYDLELLINSSYSMVERCSQVVIILQDFRLSMDVGSWDSSHQENPSGKELQVKASRLVLTKKGSAEGGISGHKW